MGVIGARSGASAALGQYLDATQAVFKQINEQGGMGGYKSEVVLLNHTYVGKAFKVTSFNAETAAYMGINTRAVTALSFAISGALAALAGFLVSPLTFASSVLGLSVGLKGFGAAVLGGLGSNRGAVVGGLLLGVVETFGGTYITAGFRDITSFLLIILVLVIRPQGLFGQHVVEKA